MELLRHYCVVYFWSAALTSILSFFSLGYHHDRTLFCTIFDIQCCMSSHTHFQLSHTPILLGHASFWTRHKKCLKRTHNKCGARQCILEFLSHIVPVFLSNCNNKSAPIFVKLLLNHMYSTLAIIFLLVFYKIFCELRYWW